MKKQINPNVKAHLIRSAFYVLLLLAFCVIPFALAQRNTTRRAVNEPKVAANTTHAVTAPTSQFRNDVVTGATKQKIAAPSTHFTNASGRVPQSAALHKRSAAPSGVCSYEFTTGADAIVPGDTDIGNHADDVDIQVTLPFPFTLYDQTFTSVLVSSNGRLDFVVANEPGGYMTSCLPAPPFIGPYDFTIFPMWQDQRTDFGLTGCASFPGGNCGVFTSVSGTAPNRIFNIEWRTVYFADNTSTANYEARLYENDPNLKFEVIIGTVQPGGNHNYVSGVQGPAGAFTEDFCDAGPPPAGSRSYTCTGTAPTPTPTPGGTCPPVITESTSQEIVDGNSAPCSNGVGTTENHYYRAFNMNTFTGGADYLVTSVSFGIEQATSGTGTGQPLTVNLYANHGSAFPGGDWQSNLIATSGEINIPDQADTIFNVPLTVTAPGSALELVMEVTTPDGTAVGNLFFVGSNPDPETGLSYLEAADCGVNTPTPTGDIGFPDWHIVFDVNGSCGGTPTPTATATATATATPRATPRSRPTPHPRPTP